MRGFTEQTNELFVANKESSSLRASSPKGIGYLSDFYTVDTIDEKDSTEVEEYLSRVETTCLPLIKQLATATDLPNSEWADIAIYMAVQYNRTPTSKAKMDEVATVITTNEVKQMLVDAINDSVKFDTLIDEITRRNPAVHTPSRDEMIKWVLKPGPLAQISIDNGTFIQFFTKLAWLNADALLKTRWIVLHAPKGSSFITSDNPMTLSIERELIAHETLALMLPGVLRHFPLNSKTCLLMLDGGIKREIRHVKISKNDVRKINQIIYAYAHKYVISGNKLLMKSLMAASR